MSTLSLSSLSLSTLKDVNSAHASRSNAVIERNEWIYFVDMETMNEVKSFYMASAKLDGTLSLMRVFNAIAKYSLTNKITF
jgi:hypothetical protein